MPEFTPTDPELWFSIIDRSFHASGITADATPRNDPVSMEAKLELRGDRRRPRSHSRSRSGNRGQSASGICWYHWRFGPDARRCTPPCSQSAQLQQGNATTGR
ncbi:hypothetical protein X777_06940 [Ooceraea biroi]|uniref:DUF7041 domain-containing protein n=1 Tax=Ooceraea biroi TaxID=2015173 RepID=A0A026WEX6_OOCBI|nr:hypothetical protein X777_06940 [Ooceraea biroi]